MINDKLIQFIKETYTNICVKKEDDVIFMFHNKSSYKETDIEIREGTISIPNIMHDDDKCFSFAISDEQVLCENDILFTGIYLVEHCLRRGYISELKAITADNEESVNKSFKMFFNLLNAKGVYCNTIIYDEYYELCLSVFTDDKLGLTGYITREGKLFSYSVDPSKTSELYAFVNESKNVNVTSKLNATDKSILNSYFQNSGFFTVCDLLHDYDFNSLTQLEEFIKIEKVLKSESKIIQDLIKINQLSLYEED